MGSAVVVVKSPTVDDPASLCQAEEQLAIQELITQLAVEALHVAVLPGAALGNEQRLDVGLAEPFAYLLRHELRPAGDSSVPNGNGSGAPTVVQADYELWKQNFGNSSTGIGAAIPEPSTVLLALAGLVGLVVRRRSW